MLDKETFIKRETEVEERKILEWCGTIFKSIIGGAFVITPLTMLYCICIRTFGIEPVIICVSLVLFLLVSSIALFFVFQFSNKIAYRIVCKSFEKEYKIQEKRKEDEHKEIKNIKLIVLFDIVRRKNVSACLIQCCKTQKEYNSCPCIIPLTQEEFDLAKEILG